MTEIGDEEAHPDSWDRHFYEGSLSAAANMLHVNGNSEDQGHTQTHYEIYKDEHGNPTLGSTVQMKLTNGSVQELVGAEQVESIFLQGGAKLVKREPQDLTRKCISPVDRAVLSDKRRIVSVSSHSDSPPALIPTQSIKDELDISLKEDRERSRANHTIVIQAQLNSDDKMSTAPYIGNFSAQSPPQSYENVSYLPNSPQHYVSAASPVMARGSNGYPQQNEAYYREFYQPTTQFVYDDMNSQPTLINSEIRPVSVSTTSPPGTRGSPAITPPTTSRTWHEFSRHPEPDKIQIPKLHSDDDKVYIDKIESNYGFKYYFESPISTSPRREDDKITYINKGQFYSITMEYNSHDPDRPIKSGTVKSVIMLMFREEKLPDDERKAWHFWHSRQHSVKQRILDVDTKNSSGIVGCIEEIAHNAIAVYWNPTEATAKVNIAIQCLSTDFSSQKGVRGLPLHIQIDTYDDPRDSQAPVFHRGYCQIKVFCDKGAERKTRDEDRRAQKRRMNPTSRKKLEDMYHTPCERYEFYSMADLTKEPVLFKPDDPVEKSSFLNSVEMQGQYYSQENENSVCGVSMSLNMDGPSPALISPPHIPSPIPHLRNSLNHSAPSPVPLATSHIPPASSCSPPSCPPTSQERVSLTTLAPLQAPLSPKYSARIHSAVSQSYGEISREVTPHITNGGITNVDEVFHQHKRSRVSPPRPERLMLFVKTDGDTFFLPLHIEPPTAMSLLREIENKYNLGRDRVRHFIRKNRMGTKALIDDLMLLYYCNEQCFKLDILGTDGDPIDIVLTEVLPGDLES